MRVALLANPESGRGDASEAERLLRDCGAEVRPFGLDEADEAAAWGADRIVAAGGDGSLGVAAATARRAGIPLAVVPVGTANDFARAVGLPRDLDAACSVAAGGTATRRLDLAWMGERPFVNLVSVGLSPVAAAKARGLKRILGALAYPVGAMRAGLTATPVRCRIACEGEPLFEGLAWQASVAVTGAFGGGADLDADPRDGRLDVVAIPATSRARLIADAYGLRLGRVESRRGVRTASGREATVETGGPATFNVDGELVEVDGARFRVEPRAFELVCG
ncbi:MAG: diacylglycerol kinase family protein [Thermoleophilaceae bacterium]